ncbi:MAG: hypothetical protein N2749_00155 [Clostridia bacterium]|nr:hypothetical protein [Clostridia bacterium]
MNNRKLGLSLVSIVLYVILFFTFVTFAVAISSNVNYSVLGQKGELYVNEQYSKLQYNLFNSAKNSQSVSLINNKIVFSNNDEYSFDTSRKVIYKNNGILVNGVDNFAINSVDTTNLVDNSKYLSYTVSFVKYGKNLTKNLFISVGDIYENQ